MGGGGVRERGTQALVDLDDMNMRDPLSEVLGEHAETTTDLEHHVLRGELGGPADHTEDVGVDQEVLPEVAVRAHTELPHAAQARLPRRVLRRAHAQPKTRAALRSTVSESSSTVTPRRAAMKASVWAT